jgi:glucose-6-phosphate isomerase
MSTPLLRYDAANVLNLTHESGGAVSAELKEILPRVQAARTEILRQARQGEQGWLQLPTDTGGLKKITSLVKKMSRFKTCLVIGIGGSDLGTRALYSALRQQEKTKPLYFVGSNTDPDELHEVLAQLDLRHTLVNIVSKSGGTIEPMATFLLFEALPWLERYKQIVAHDGCGAWCSSDGSTEGCDIWRF